MTRSTRRARKAATKLNRNPTRTIARRVGSALLFAIAAALSVTVADMSSQAPAGGPRKGSLADTTPRVVVNHTVPRVSAPALLPTFSDAPTERELRAARVFAEPLLPLGPSTPAENQALAAAVTRYAHAAKPLELQPFTDFLQRQPSSVWRASVQANLGGLHRAAGYFSRALQAWDDAWALSKDDPSVQGRAIAETSAGQALHMLASMGQVSGLDRWLARTASRPMTGPAAVQVSRAREVRALIATHPELVVASGPKALEVLLDWRAGATRSGPRDVPPAVPAILKAYRPTADGMSLRVLQILASQVGLTLRAVRREAGAPLVTPAIVHLGFDHFSAVLEEVAGRFRVRDPALGGEVWMTREALDEEMTGTALIGATPDAPGWRPLSDADAAAVIGHSCPAGLPDPDECPCPESEPGMPTYSLHPVQASVLLADAPLGYAPPRGPSVYLQLRYNHREENQPQVFAFANLGAKWTLNWLAYVEEVPFTDFGTYAMPANLAVHVPQGGVERFQYEGAGGVFERHYRSAAVLVHVSDSPLTYERRHTDGSKEVYALSDGGVPGTRRVFLTAMVDPYGQQLAFTWDGQVRLVAVTDALGQVTTLQYDDPDPLKITSVTDPFGRIARFTYDSAGHLVGITDVIHLSSSFVYGDADFIAGLQTPYGLTAFREPVIAGENARAIEAIDPLGAVERVEFWRIGAPVPAAVPAGEVPAGFEGVNAQLDTITSLHWAKGRTVTNVQEATVSRWLVRSLDWFIDPGWTVGVPLSVQRPSEARRWFGYVGSTTRPARVARKLPDGSISEVNASYNYQDNVTWSRDPVGREMTYTYAANGIDLLEVRNTTGGRSDRLALYGDYTAGHQAQTLTDAAGQVTQTTYNGFGQVLTVTNAKQETTTYAYDPNGLLQTVTGPVTGATVTYAYDAYGRVQSATPPGEAVVTTTYDALNRPTRTTYADGTYEETTYNRLDVATRRDRKGRLTRFTYDVERRLIATRDPAGRVIQQQFCPCGALDALIDANGNATRWERDAAGRVLREVRADGVTATVYTYDALGQVKTVTDPKQQVTTYTYNLDGSVASVVYTNAQIATPGVAWTYDAAYARVSTMVDGTGTTSYTYHPVAQLGAGQVATVDGPLANDVISYAYDQLGRVATRAIDGVPLSLTYDALGRVQQEVNTLGTFAYGYDGASGRLATVTYPNNQTSAYLYYPAAQDHRLQTIDHRYPSGAILSKFDYTYDAVGNIQTWRQQADTSAVIWDYGYDNADQLTRAVKHATGPQGTILQRFAYGYDPAGNRLFEQIDDTVTAWTYDRLNRLVTQQAGGLLRVTGTVNEAATVRVNGQPAAIDGAGLFVGGVQVAPGTTRFTVTATDASGNTATNQYDVDQVGVPRTFTFDANGNMTSDGTRTFEWNAVNELASVNSGPKRTELLYDGFQRRVALVEKELGSTVDTKQFVWCGKSLCEELGMTGVAPRHFQTRGMRQGTESLFYAQDHLASTHDLTDGAGTLRGRYTYDPYGNRLAVENDRETEVGFTGHYTHDSSGLILSPHRAYDPILGRWISADPVGVAGGLNLYAYTDSSPVTFADPLGLVKVTIRELEIYRLPQKDVPRKGCAASKRGITPDGSCLCRKDGKWYASLSVTYLPQIWLANDVVVIHPGLLIGYTSQDVLLKHELTHYDSNMQIVGEIQRSGEQLERQPFPSKDSCRAAVDKWKQHWTNEIRSRQDDWLVGNFIRAIRCW